MILDFFQYILQQKADSILFRMLMAQIMKPTKNDFYQVANSTLQEFGIHLTAKEVKLMKKSTYKNIVKKKCTETAFNYLIDKQKSGSKGAGINYNCLEMADYLLPQANISLEDQRESFSIRCRTNALGANRGIEEYCETQCGKILNNAHIFQCNILNNNRQDGEMRKILNGYISEKKAMLTIWRENMKRRESFLRIQLDC